MSKSGSSEHAAGLGDYNCVSFVWTALAWAGYWTVQKMAGASRVGIEYSIAGDALLHSAHRPRCGDQGPKGPSREGHRSLRGRRWRGGGVGGKEGSLMILEIGRAHV